MQNASQVLCRFSLPAVLVLMLALVGVRPAGANPAGATDKDAPPVAGKVATMPSSDLKPGMKGVAWTVFQGSQPEQVPIEIIGLWKNAWGPRQDIILAKMGGKAERTNVAGGMSGSPVYIDGKLVGAVALRLSVFSPDAICGITPIDLMLEINDFDESRPLMAKTPRSLNPLSVPSDVWAQAVAAGYAPALPTNNLMLTPIETPLTFSGFNPSVLEAYGSMFQQMGVVPVQGGAAGATSSATPVKGWQKALQPGQAISGVLVSGDMTISGMGTVTYNDGKKVLAFGHSFFNLGPVEMPMANADVLTVLSSKFQPNKVGNAGDIVGALTQDRHSGILGTLGAEAKMVPVHVKVRTFDTADTIRKEKDFRFNVFVQQQWTPQLMMLTLFNSISGLNDFRDEATYRLSGTIKLSGDKSMSLSTMQTAGEVPVPAPIMLAGWWGEKFNRLYGNPLSIPDLQAVDVNVDLLPERRVATIQHAWSSVKQARPGENVNLKVFLQPYRGEMVVKEFPFTLPASLAPGEYTILCSDAATLDRMQKTATAMNRFLDLDQTVSLINQERANDQLYISLVQASPTIYYDDKVMPSLPQSMLNLMQGEMFAARRASMSSQSFEQQVSEQLDFIVNGSFPVRIEVR